MENRDSVEVCSEFFSKAYPNSQPKNFRTQLGVHLEEIAEMLDSLKSTNDGDTMLFHYLSEAVKGASNHLKTTDDLIEFKNRVEFLDGIADQMVTAVGLGYHAKMDVLGAFKEVNRSNLSKFDDNGEPILDNNLKLMKGPNYTKPDLKSFA